MKKTKDSVKIKGKVTICGYKAGTLKKIEPLMFKLKDLTLKSGNQAIITQIRADIHAILQKGKLSEVSNHNLIMTGANIGRDLIVQALNGFLVSPVYGLAINYLAIGTGATAPTATDTQLTAEVARAVIAYSQDITYNELLLQAFFTDAQLANGTYKEVGSFVGGTASLNSGQIFNHALFAAPYVKTAGMDTTVQITFTIS